MAPKSTSQKPASLRNSQAAQTTKPTVSFTCGDTAITTMEPTIEGHNQPMLQGGGLPTKKGSRISLMTSKDARKMKRSTKPAAELANSTKFSFATPEIHYPTTTKTERGTKIAELEAILKLCKENGVTSLTLDGVSIELSGTPLEATPQVLPKKNDMLSKLNPNYSNPALWGVLNNG